MERPTGTVSLRTADGLRLVLRRWPRAGARGTVLVVHGLGEHAGRYARTAAALNEAGWSVLGHDQRGHGESDGRRGVIAAAHSLLADLALVIDAVRAEAPGPLVLLGDSLGGVVAARFVAEAGQPRPAPWSRVVDGLVLVAPALDPALTAWQRLQLVLLRRLAPDLTVASGLDPNDLSHDPEVARAYAADALVHDRISARLARFVVDGGAFVLREAARWRVPTFVAWGGADRIVSPAGSAAFVAAAPRALVTPWHDAAMFHEPLNEIGREALLARLAGWLATLQGPPPPGDRR